MKRLLSCTRHCIPNGAAPFICLHTIYRLRDKKQCEIFVFLYTFRKKVCTFSVTFNTIYMGVGTFFLQMLYLSRLFRKGGCFMRKRVKYLLACTFAIALLLGLMPLAQAEPITCEILSFRFTLDGQCKHAMIDNESSPGIITIVVPGGADIKTQMLTPEIELPLGASILPPANEPQDFSKLVRYTVSIWDREQPVTREYIVRVMESKPATARVVSGFSINGVQGIVNEFNKTILVALDKNTDFTNLTPAITHYGVSISPSASEAMDFSSPVRYTIVMENGAMETYTVVVTADTE